MRRGFDPHAVTDPEALASLRGEPPAASRIKVRNRLTPDHRRFVEALPARAARTFY